MDFAALASRMAAGLDGVQACLIVSGDGLSLGCYPEQAEARAKEVWDRLTAVGDPQRGFFNVGDEVWVVARRGWYAALLIASPRIKPGVALDRLETYLKVAEEARVREATELSPAAGAPEPPRRLRAPVHREARVEPRPEVQRRPEVGAPQAPAPSPRVESETAAAPAGRPAERADSFAFGPQASAPAPAPPMQAPPPSSEPPPVVVEPVVPSEPAVSPPVRPAVPEPPSQQPIPEPPSAAPPEPEPVSPPEPEPEPEAPSVAPQTEPPAPEPVPEIPSEEASTAQPVAEPPSAEVEPPARATPGTRDQVETRPETVEEEPRTVVVDMTRADVPVTEREVPATEEEQKPARRGEPRQGGTEVDRVALTREFAQLFDVERPDEPES